MTRRILTLAFTFIAGAMVGRVALPSIGARWFSPDVVQAQTRKAVIVTRLYTGPDDETHATEMEMQFKAGTPGQVSTLLPVTAAEIHRTAPGGVSDWHRGPRRQYVITLSGHGELEVSGGKKIPVGPGSIELIEDTTGKGHITKVTGNDDRVTLQLVLAN
jgi:hypothetical protein